MSKFIVQPVLFILISIIITCKAILSPNSTVQNLLNVKRNLCHGRDELLESCLNDDTEQNIPWSDDTKVNSPVSKDNHRGISDALLTIVNRIQYTKFNDSSQLEVSSKDCFCNGHSNSCHKSTNDHEKYICDFCSSNTTGDNCELCLPGFFKVFSRETVDKQSFVCLAINRKLNLTKTYNADITAAETSSVQLIDEDTIKNEPIDIIISSNKSLDKLRLNDSIKLTCKFNIVDSNRSINNEYVGQNIKQSFNLTWIKLQTLKHEDEVFHKGKSLYGNGDSVQLVRHEDGLELNLRKLSRKDIGAYICQAINSTDANLSVINEALVSIYFDDSKLDTPSSSDNKVSPQAQTTYLGDESKETSALDKFKKMLLPKIRILPNFLELKRGETARFSCITDFDVDNNTSKLEWYLVDLRSTGHTNPSSSIHINSSNLVPNVDMKQQSVVNLSENEQLEYYNATIYDQSLFLWSVRNEDTGMYKCIYTDTNTNFSVEANGYLLVHEMKESAPIVDVKPQILQLLPNSLATIICEITGYPPPSISWLRAENLHLTEFNHYNETNSKSHDYQKLYLENDDSDKGSSVDKYEDQTFQVQGIKFDSISYRQAFEFCFNEFHIFAKDIVVDKNGKDKQRRQENFCSNFYPKQQDIITTNKQSKQITKISTLVVKKALNIHQGQYVCRADNRHGSNQAFATLDVEFKLKPVVDVTSQKTQFIDLTNKDYGSATFNCTTLTGKPSVELRWLRIANYKQLAKGKRKSILSTKLAALKKSRQQNNDTKKLFVSNSESDFVLDLSKESSATSQVSLVKGNNFLTMTITTGSFEDEGEYVCAAENEAGIDYAFASLQILQAAKVKILQQSPIVVKEYSSFQLECLSFGRPTPRDLEWNRQRIGSLFSLVSKVKSTGSSSSYERAVLRFDKVSHNDAGEYACLAFDTNNNSLLRDTAMLVVDSINGPKSINQTNIIQFSGQPNDNETPPELAIRPAKIEKFEGESVILDCLVVSGSQPIAIEWLPPDTLPTLSDYIDLKKEKPIKLEVIKSYNSLNALYHHNNDENSIFQFGSKLKIYNLTKYHEGIYQCKGKNKFGVENAPAYVRVRDKTGIMNTRHLNNDEIDSYNDTALLKSKNILYDSHEDETTKTKVAIAGTNIELKCHIVGESSGETLATSWSRNGRGLPAQSWQVSHNLWIQNVTSDDDGLYVCFLRSNEPNRIIKARVNLVVRQAHSSIDSTYEGGYKDTNGNKRKANYTATIVASKQQIRLGDSVTLECIIKRTDMMSTNSTEILSERDDSVEKSVVWSNAFSGLSLFPDNIYTVGNLLIIYDMKQNNIATTYRCNYKDEYLDYKLPVFHDEKDSQGKQRIVDEEKRSDIPHPKITFNDMKVLQVSAGSRVELNCEPTDLSNVIFSDTLLQLQFPNSQETIAADKSNRKLAISIGARVTNFWWLKSSKNIRLDTRPKSSLLFNSISLADADLYFCQGSLLLADGNIKYFQASYIVSVYPIAASFAQNPVSFVTLPAVTGAYDELSLEMKFVAEKDHGLMFFNGQSNGHANGDFVSLGLNNRFVEFRYDLGDGVTLLKSNRQVDLNKWYRVVVERNRTLGSLWLEGGIELSSASGSNNNLDASKSETNTNASLLVTQNSRGNFYNLDLDSVIYVGGHQYFMRRQYASVDTSSTDGQLNTSYSAEPDFYGFNTGFSGCISELRLFGKRIDLLDTKRSVSIGVYECVKSECDESECNKITSICQVLSKKFKPPRYSGNNSTELLHYSHASFNQRCICVHEFTGNLCQNIYKSTAIQSVAPSNVQHFNTSMMSECQTIFKTYEDQFQYKQTQSNKTNQKEQCLCIKDNMVKINATNNEDNDDISDCFRDCLKKLSPSIEETRVFMNGNSYIHLKFNSVEEILKLLSSSSFDDNIDYQKSTQQTTTSDESKSMQKLISSLSNYSKQSVISEHLNVSFSLVSSQSKHGSAILFYSGQIFPVIALNNLDIKDNKFTRRLPSSNNSDYFVIMMNNNGFIEVSYELGSGTTSLKGLTKVNDGLKHSIKVIRDGKKVKLFVDRKLEAEVVSSGRHSMLNTHDDIYIGGLPTILCTTNNSNVAPKQQTTFKYEGFEGCLNDVEINSFGPINLVRDSLVSTISSSVNIKTCLRNTNKQQTHHESLSGFDDGDET